MKNTPIKQIDYNEVREHDEYTHDHKAYHSLLRYIRHCIKHSAVDYGWVYNGNGESVWVNRGVVLVNRDMMDKVL